MGGGEAGSDFESLNATGQKGDLILSFIALFITFLGLCLPYLGFDQKTFLRYLRTRIGEMYSKLEDASGQGCDTVTSGE